jgi:hypothetical protein
MVLKSQLLKDNLAVTTLEAITYSPSSHCGILTAES